MTADVISAAWQHGRDLHPGVQVDEAAFRAFVGDRSLDGRQLGDLYLACGLAQADPAAIATFERATLPAVQRGLARMQADHAELLQVLREQMLVKRGIVAYDGRAPLATWLRVCAARLGQREANRQRRNVGDDSLDQLAPGVPDPELAYLRRHYGDQFRAAFAEAVAELAPRERNLLRHAVLDALSIDQIAAIYHVHRATAARQLKSAREALIAATRERMRVTLGVGPDELDSILRVLASMVDMTLRQVLGRRPQEST